MKTGLFPEEVVKFKGYLEMDKEERPTWEEMAAEFRVEPQLLKDFFPKPKPKPKAGENRRVKPDNPDNT